MKSFAKAEAAAWWNRRRLPGKSAASAQRSERWKYHRISGRPLHWWIRRWRSIGWTFVSYGDGNETNSKWNENNSLRSGFFQISRGSLSSKHGIHARSKYFLAHRSDLCFDHDRLYTSKTYCSIFPEQTNHLEAILMSTLVYWKSLTGSWKSWVVMNISGLQ